MPGLKFNHSELENRLMSMMTVVDRPETVLFNTKIIKNIAISTYLRSFLILRINSGVENRAWAFALAENLRANLSEYGYTRYVLMKSMAVVITRPAKSKSA